MQGLVLRRETLVTGSRTNVLDLMQKVFVLFGKVRDFVAKNLFLIFMFSNAQRVKFAVQ